MQTARFNDANSVGGSDVVTDAIEEAEVEVTNDYGNPYKKSTFILESTQTRYEFRVDDKKTYRIDRVIVRQNDNTRRVYAEGTASEVNQQFTADLEFNTITFASATVASYDGCRVEIDYVPTEFHQLTRIIAALTLLDNANVTNAEEDTPSLGVRLLQRKKRIEDAIIVYQAAGSLENVNYDPTYGEVIPQRRFYVY